MPEPGSPTDSDSRRWRVPNGIVLRRRIWDDEGVVYHPLSGETHLLNVTAIVVLDLIEAGPRSVPGLVDALIERNEAAEDADDDPGARATMTEQVAELVGHLDALGLVEPCP